ncbi:MAG: magnesium transporter [Terrimicrobiaceae bacterium]|jgi:magnesium transporter
MVPSETLQKPVMDFASRDFPVLDESLTVGEAIERVRARGLRDKIIYFYVIEDDGRLVGVLPTRRLLTESVETQVSDAMIRRVVAIPERATLLEACEFFVLHKFLAFPVVDEGGRIVGVVDVSVFTSEVLDLAEREQMDDLFQSLGFRASELRSASPLRAFRLRFPWLLATIAGGTVCAILAGAFAETLEQRIVLAFFLTMVLGLGESVSAQSVAVTLQAMHRSKPTWAWLFAAVRKEFATAVLLGAACGGLVAGIVVLWRGDTLAALSIGLSIWLSMITACLLGVVIPAGSRSLRWDPRIAAGPLTLALADVGTLALYFTLAKWLLGAL